MVTKEQALEIARHELARYGYLVSDYEVTVDAESSESNVWIIWCEKKGAFPVPGGTHGVRVDKTTGHSQFLPGE